jgi:hypothetical protein
MDMTTHLVIDGVIVHPRAISGPDRLTERYTQCDCSECLREAIRRLIAEAKSEN